MSCKTFQKKEKRNCIILLKGRKLHNKTKTFYNKDKTNNEKLIIKHIFITNDIDNLMDHCIFTWLRI